MLQEAKRAWLKFGNDLNNLGGLINNTLFRTRWRTIGVILFLIFAVAVESTRFFEDRTYVDPRTFNGTCFLASEVANRVGWDELGGPPEDVTRYGGTLVIIERNPYLPQGYEAIWNKGGMIQYDDLDRELPKNELVSIYPSPDPECRKMLGVAA